MAGAGVPTGRPAPSPASGGRLGGGGVATAGFVTGLIGTIWSGFAALTVILVFVFGAAARSSFEQSCPSDPNYASSCR